MQKNILLTSFDTWKPHHVSNSSDDLLERFSSRCHRPLHYLRRLPVDFHEASSKVLARFNELKPDLLVCCGMAEEREKLGIESRAVLNGKTLETDVDLDALTRGLEMTEISHDAGRFVCNTLYYRALDHLKRLRRQCVFVHVPLLHTHNAICIESDFHSVVERLSAAHAAGE